MRRGEVTRVSSKGQIVLPKQYRDDLNIQEGDYLSIYEVDDGVLLVEKLKLSPLEAIAADLREEAKRQKFTREELESAIKSRRSERRPDAAAVPDVRQRKAGRGSAGRRAQPPMEGPAVDADSV